MQQTYVSAFTHVDQFAAAARFSTWLLRIGINEALGRLRQRRRHLQPIDDRSSVATGCETARRLAALPEGVAKYMILAAVAAQASAGTFTMLLDHVAQGFEALGIAVEQRPKRGVRLDFYRLFGPPDDVL